MGEKTGYIYILTNRAFEEYVKIGYAGDVEERLKQLNRSECVPYAFRLYATYQVQSRLDSDKKLHKLIDSLNPDLRTIDTVNGKTRKRELYAMSAEQAYEILKAMAEIHGCEHRLHRYQKSADEKRDDAVAQEIEAEHQSRMSPFSFERCGIMPGEEVEYKLDPDIKAVVLNDKRVEYQGMSMSLSALAKQLTGRHNSVEGPRYFTYKGEPLNDRRRRLRV